MKKTTLAIGATAMLLSIEAQANDSSGMPEGGHDVYNFYFQKGPGVQSVEQGAQQRVQVQTNKNGEIVDVKAEKLSPPTEVAVAETTESTNNQPKKGQWTQPDGKNIKPRQFFNGLVRVYAGRDANKEGGKSRFHVGVGGAVGLDLVLNLHGNRR